MSRQPFPLMPNTMVYFGNSSTPKHCLILSADEDYVTYRMWPYAAGTSYRISRWEMDLLAPKGMQNRIAELRHAMERSSGEIVEYYAGEIAKLAATMQGTGPTVDPASLEAVYVSAIYQGSKEGLRSNDPWYAAEEYGGVGARESDEGTVYLIASDRGRVARMEATGDWKIKEVTARTN